MLGLENSGKTGMLYKLKGRRFVATVPTIGLNVETVEYKNIRFTVIDVGGQEKVRPLWRHYYKGTHAVIFVVDSNARDRISEAAYELQILLREEELKDAVLLVFGNKKVCFRVFLFRLSFVDFCWLCVYRPSLCLIIRKNVGSAGRNEPGQLSKPNRSSGSE